MARLLQPVTIDFSAIRVKVSIELEGTVREIRDALDKIAAALLPKDPPEAEK